MAAGRIKGITIEIGGDTTKLVKALSNVDNAISKTQTNLRDINKALKLDPSNTALLKDRQEELAKAIEETKSKLDIEKEAYEQLSQADQTPENVEKMRQLKTQIDLDTAALKDLEDQARSAASVLGTQMQNAGEKIKEVGEKIKNVGDKITGLGQTMTTHVTAPILAAFGASAKAAIDWESAFTGVMKTVDETANTTYQDLKDGINEIAQVTASSQNDIAATMEIAGQLGVSADNILEFTETMVKLGDTTNLSSEEAASAIAKFANVTGMSLSDVDALGAAIVDLGNNYATTEADIMEMATRLSGAGAQVGLTQGQILGLATAMSSVGIQAEMGGSAMSKAMIKMQVAVETGFDQVHELTEKAGMSLRDIELMSTNDSKSFKALASSLGMTTTEIKEVIKNGNNLMNFADVAMMETDEFVDLYRNDAPAALQAFIQGLGDTDSHGETTIAMLQEMGFTEVRLRDTLTRLANSQDLVTDAMAQGQAAYEEQAALDAEAEKRYATMEAQLQQLKNQFTEVAVSIGEMLMPYIQQLIGFIEGLIEKWNSLDQSQQQLIIKIAAIVAAIGPALVIVGSVISAIGTIVTGIGSVISVIGTVLSVIAGIASVVGAPIMFVIGLVGAIIAVFVALWNNCEEFRNFWITLWEETKAAFEVAGDAIKAGIDGIVTWFSELPSKIDAFVKSIVSGVKADIEQAKSFVEMKFEEIKTKITNALTNVKSNIQSIMTNIRTVFSTGWQNVKDTISNAISSIKQTFESWKTSISDTFSDLKEKMKTWAKDMIDNFIQGIKDKFQAVKDTLTSLGDLIKSYIGFSEPDLGPLSNFHTFAPDMMKLFSEGITENANLITDAITKSFNLQPVIMGTMDQRLLTADRSQGSLANEQPINVNIALEGDAGRLFRIVSIEANRNREITGQVFAL